MLVLRRRHARAYSPMSSSRRRRAPPSRARRPGRRRDQPLDPGYPEGNYLTVLAYRVSSVLVPRDVEKHSVGALVTLARSNSHAGAFYFTQRRRAVRGFANVRVRDVPGTELAAHHARTSRGRRSTRAVGTHSRPRTRVVARLARAAWGRFGSRRVDRQNARGRARFATRRRRGGARCARLLLDASGSAEIPKRLRGRATSGARTRGRASATRISSFSERSTLEP